MKSRQSLSIKLLLSVLTIFLWSCGSGEGDPPAQTLSLNGPSTIFGLQKMVQLEASLNGVATNSGLVWSSSNGSIATINNQGVLTSGGQGSTDISVRLDDQTVTQTIEVFNASGVGVESVDEVIKDFMDQYQVPGATFSIVRDGQLLLTRGYGFADLEARTYVSPSTIFRVASVSKSITAAATMKLIDNGALKLSDKLFDVLSSFLPNNNLFDQRIREITIEQLLHHTSGSDIQPQPLFNQADIASDLSVDAPPSIDQIVSWFVFRDMQNDPGSVFKYHDLNYFMLGKVISEVSGQSYEDFVRNEIFAPLGITTARLARTRKSERWTNEVTYYEPNSQLFTSIFPSEGQVQGAYGGWGAVELWGPSGGWVISSVDLARFSLAIDGVLGSNEILSVESQSFVSNPGTNGYGGGLYVTTSGRWSHLGGLPGTGAYIWSDGEGLIVTMSFNATPPFLTTENDAYFQALETTLINAARNANLDDQDLFDQF